MITAGVVVKHPIHGMGTVVDKRLGGFQLLVKLDSGKTAWFRRDELSICQVQPAVEAPAPSKAAHVNGSFKSRRMIEAFRLGIVPFDCVEEFTFGRDEEIAQISAWLASERESSFIVYGDYGTGKTHLLSHVQAMALRSGYAVAYVSMSQDESPFYKPKRVFSELARSFRAVTPDGKSYNFRQFVTAALAGGGYREHIYFKHLAHTDKDILWDWIEANHAAGRPVEMIEASWGGMVPSLVKVPSLYDYSKAANIYCYLLSSLGFGAQKYFGLKGLLLLFDESEWIGHVNYGYQQSMAYNFLKGLLLTAQGRNILLDDPKEALLSCGLEYAMNARHTPYLYNRNSGLKLLFAFTDASIGRQVPELLCNPQITLKKLGVECIRDLSEKLCSIYVQSYPGCECELELDLEDTNYATRYMVKKIVERLDIDRFAVASVE